MLTQETFATYSTPIIVLFIVLEMIYSYYAKKELYSTIETVTNFYLTALNIGLNLIVKALYVLFIYEYFYEHRLFQIEHVFLYWFALVILEDFLYFLLHWMDHVVRIFWAVHVTHHSSKEFNITTGFRSSVFQPIYRFVFFIPLAVIGFTPIDIMLVYSITQIWGIFVHTKTIGKLPKWVGAIFVTPSHHRVHHGSNLIYLDKNMGMMLIIWDRLFGTFQEEVDEEVVDYGLVCDPEDRGPINIVFHELSQMAKDVTKDISWKDRFRYIFNPPGWSHDGSTMTTKQMLEEVKNQNHT